MRILRLLTGNQQLLTLINLNYGMQKNARSASGENEATAQRSLSFYKAKYIAIY